MRWQGKATPLGVLAGALLLLVACGPTETGEVEAEGGPEQQACQPTTCAAQGARCGSLEDGCGGTLACGSCEAPQTCGGGGTPNVCGAPACTPLTCAQVGASCGSVADGCGGTLSCGTCGEDETCGGGGVPNVCGTGSCTPTTCEARGATCGSIPDGCGGTLSCGTCDEGASCGGAGTPNQCGPGTCTPTTCEAEGKTCGTLSDGCGGTLACGRCGEGQTCGRDNICVGRPSAKDCFTARRVPTPAGFERATADAISAKGLVLGWAIANGGERTDSLLWNPSSGALRTLGLPQGYTRRWSYDVNDAGQVVGELLPTAAGPRQAFLWNAGVDYLLPPLAGDTQAVALTVSAGGMAAGNSFTEGGWSRPVLWRDGKPTPLPSLVEGKGTWVSALNDAGVIVGGAYDAQNRVHAVRWVDGALEDLGALGNNPNVSQGALDVASDGAVLVGTGLRASHLLLPDGRRLTLTGVKSTQVPDVQAANAAHDAVGRSWEPSGSDATLWRKGHALRLEDLIVNPPPKPISLVRDLNDAGEVVAFTEAGSGYLLQPAACPPRP